MVTELQSISEDMFGGGLGPGLIGALLGLIIGSYLSTLLVRWPQGRSALASRSACDGCHQTLRWWELVPIVAYVIQRGRCRRCGAPIAWQHGASEALCGAVGGYLASQGWFLLLPFCWLVIILGLFDVLYLWLPDRLVIPLAIAAVFAPSWDAELGLWGRLAGGLCGFGSLWLLRVAYARIRRRNGLGKGDAKLFGAMGLWLGPLMLPQVMVLACGIGLIDAALRWRRRDTPGPVHLPLGSYLALSCLVLALAMPLEALQSWRLLA